jgi:hypothetical protein
MSCKRLVLKEYLELVEGPAVNNALGQLPPGWQRNISENGSIHQDVFLLIFFISPDSGPRTQSDQLFQIRAGEFGGRT